MEEEIKEKKEFLRREEVRTMQKDIERLREEEAKKERERIAALKTEEEARIEREKVERIKREAEERKKIEEKRKEIAEREIVEKIRKRARELERKRIEEREKEKKLIKKPVPRKSSLFEKIFIRLAIVVIIFLILANLFLYWYWYLKKPLPSWLPQFLRPPQIEEVGPPEVVPPPEEVPPPKEVPPPEEVLPPEIIIHSSLIPIQTTTTLGISALEALPTALSQVFKESFTEEQFTRILIKDIVENKILDLKEFFEAFEIRAPEGFYQKLSKDFTLFIYTIERRNSLGFVTKITEKEGLADLLKSWEPTMEEDFKNLSIALGKAKPAISPEFKEKIYKEVTLRYLTIAPEPDYFGICYGFFKDYFIYSSSCHNTLKVIDILKKENR